MKYLSTIFAIAVMAVVGCNQQPAPKTTGDNSSHTVEYTAIPTFNLGISEYPSWSIFATASKAGLINGKKGEQGTLEKKWNVDLVLQTMDYDPCMVAFSNNTADAVCITNIDILNLARGRKCTAIMPTSTSDGADKIIAIGFSQMKDLVGQKIYGLSKSVSQYSVYREAEKSGLDPNSIEFVNLDPAAAATALQTNTGDVKAICVWNPFAMQTLRNKKESVLVGDSKMIPEEIIDMIVVGDDSLAKEGGDRFAALICDTYYQINDHLNSADQKIADATLMVLSEDFFQLPLDDMKVIVTETRFYNTPNKGETLFGGDSFKKTMEEVVVPTCKKLQMFDNNAEPPTVGYNDATKQLNFSTKYIEMATSKK